MPKTKKNERYISTRNYVIAFIVMALIVVLTLYGFKWYEVYEENKVSQSYLIKEGTIKNEIKDLNEIEAIFSEAPDEYFIYISYSNDENIYKMEKDLKELILDYNLQDKFYYINVTDIKTNDNYIEELNEALNLDEQKITKVPTILYYKNGTLTKGGILNRDDDNIISAADFQQFLDIKDIEK